MKLALIFAAAVLSAQETVSNGIRIKTTETTEGISVFVTPSGCTTEAIRVQLRTSGQTGWEKQEGIKTVSRCDSRPVEFRFALPGAVVMISVYELSQSNAGSAK